MKILTDFLFLRPVFTRRALLAIWYVYLATAVLQIAQYLFLVLGTRQAYPAGISPEFYISLIAPFVYTLAYLGLVRIFLEMALHFIEKRSLTA